MIWHDETISARILPFPTPSSGRPKSRPAPSRGEPEGRILLFTGVRYERVPSIEPQTCETPGRASRRTRG